MARKRATLDDLLNDLSFKCLYEKFKLVSVNNFKWNGLPDWIKERHLESYLFDDGKAIFFRDPQMDVNCLQVQNGHGINVHGDPLNYIAYGYNYNKVYPADQCVIIENNKLRIPTKQFILYYVQKLAEADRTMDVNIKSCKTPVIFACDDKDVLTFKRIFQQVDGNTPAIFADRGLNLNSITAYQTGATFMGVELMEYANNVENKLLTFLGVNNNPVDKKERLITDEANANNQLIDNFVQLQLEARERACEEINTMFGLNISVERRSCGENYVESGEKSDDLPVKS